MAWTGKISSTTDPTLIIQTPVDQIVRVGKRAPVDVDVIILSNTQLINTLDGDVVKLICKNLTIDNGFTLTTLNRCNGLIIHVEGDLTLNGSISMTSRGSTNSSPSNVNIYDPCTNDLLCTIPSSGGQGGFFGSPHGWPGIGRGTGGGGSATNGYNAGTGTAYSGGSGSGCSQGATGGGKGGDGCGSGAGNPPGTPSGTYGTSGGTGNGGLLVINVKGNILIGSNGIICADGSDGGGNYGPYSDGGGGSGGGSVNIFHTGTYTNNGTIRANGGQGGVADHHGGNGGNGCITITQL